MRMGRITSPHAKNSLEAYRQYHASLTEADLLTLAGSPGTRSLAGWFLGTKGENETVFRRLMTMAVEEHIKGRQAFHPEDPEWITPDIKQSEAYRQTIAELEKQTRQLLDELKQSVPFYSMRYQAHMLWDITMPGAIGYFAAMLYNQNNVAVEASSVTTKLEMEVGNDLCAMLGYPLEGDENGITPWGHITCDGSVANLEALWAARNVKLYPLALKAALVEQPELAPARSVQVRLLDGSSAPLVKLDTWTLLNLRADDVLALPQRIKDEYDIPLKTIGDALTPYSVQNIGLVDFYKRFMQGIDHSPVCFTPVTKHYSWPKGAAILGLGANHAIGIRVDLDGRMDMQHLRRELERCLQERIPVTAVVAVIGSTEESAVDPLSDILDMREAFRRRGLDFLVHADAAWGGYFASMLRPDPAAPRTARDIPEYPLSDYVTRQLEMLAKTDSITVDPHKSGYIPYPAGGLCYRNSAMRNIVSFTAPVIYHNETDPTVGIYGVEGSKPGAAAASVYLSHKVIRPDQTGYGKILGQCTFTSNKLFAQLVSMEDERFRITMLNRIPAEREPVVDPRKVQAQKTFIRKRIAEASNEQLLNDPEAMALFRELGPDLVISAYAFNFRTKSGAWNRDIKKVNELNARLFNLLSVRPGEDMSKVELIVTASEFDPAVYGDAFMNAFCERLGVMPDGTTPIPFLISTVMNPWTSDTPQGSFLTVIEQALRNAVYRALSEMKEL